MGGESPKVPTPQERAQRRERLQQVASRLAISARDESLKQAFSLYSTGANNRDIDYALRDHPVDRTVLTRMILQHYDAQRT